MKMELPYSFFGMQGCLRTISHMIHSEDFLDQSLKSLILST